MVKPRLHSLLAGAAVAVLTAAPTISRADQGDGTMAWTAYLDHYCERVAPGFWGEPLNALSNIAFLAAAGLVLERNRRAAWRDRPTTLLALLAASVGVGSFLFHTFANRWSLIADIVPIALFIYAFFFLALQRFLRLGAIAAGVATAALVVLSPVLKTALEPLLGASATYAPGFIATFGVAVAVPAFRRGPAPTLLLGAGLAFAIALTFRMLDLQVCGTWPSGTHFLWHLFNGLAVGLALLAAQQVGPAGILSRRTNPAALSTAH